jgi:hypothetical protein
VKEERRRADRAIKIASLFAYLSMQVSKKLLDIRDDIA